MNEPAKERATKRRHARPVFKKLNLSLEKKKKKEAEELKKKEKLEKKREAREPKRQAKLRLKEEENKTIIKMEAMQLEEIAKMAIK